MVTGFNTADRSSVKVQVCDACYCTLCGRVRTLVAHFIPGVDAVALTTARAAGCCGTWHVPAPDGALRVQAQPWMPRCHTSHDVT